MTTSFESLIAQLAEQNREAKRKQYELKAHNEHLESLAFTDTLTGPPNRAMLKSTLTSEIATVGAFGKPFSVLFVDLDNLKAINDAQGHAKGDAALRATAARIRRALRDSDFLARLAGDEFVIVSANITTASDTVKLSERLTVWLGISLPEDEWTLPIRASIGVTVFPDHGTDAHSLMHAADQAMYRAKARATALASLGFEKTDEGFVLSLPGPLLFETGSDVLSISAKTVLAKLAADLRALDIKKLRLFGHTDIVGSAEFNRSLSGKRA